MGKRQRQWAKQARDRLFDALGRKCQICGSEVELEFDVIIPAENNHHHRKMDWSHRMSFYRQQHKQHNLQVLCSPCNSAKGDKPTELPL